MSAVELQSDQAPLHWPKVPEERLQMCKKSLRLAQKADGELVADAARYARELTEKEYSGPGDMTGAMRRIAMRLRLPYTSLWALRYRPPKVVSPSVYLKLRDAWEAAIEPLRAQQMRALIHDIGTTAAQAGPAAHSVRAALAVVDAEINADAPEET